MQRKFYKLDHSDVGVFIVSVLSCEWQTQTSVTNIDVAPIISTYVSGHQTLVVPGWYQVKSFDIGVTRIRL